MDILETNRKLQKQLLGEIGSYNKPKKNRVKLTPSQQLYVWEHPKLYGKNVIFADTR